MAENSNIEWCNHTFNPWSGCTKVSPACDHCYAEVNYSVKMRGVKWGKYGNRIIASDSMWNQPLVWNRKAEAERVRKRVFCASLADVFEGSKSMPAEAVEPINAARERLFRLIETTHHLDWMLLTKRPENVMDMLPVRWKTTCTFKREPANRIPKNVWIGTTAENQKYADLRIAELVKIPAAVRFLSIEPMLGPVNLEEWFWMLKGAKGARTDLLQLVIVGGESGSKARPMHPDWPRSLRDQCVAADVSFFFKQWGNWFSPLQISTKEIHSSKIIWPDGTTGGGSAYEHGGFGSHVINVGKKNAGRLLDGRTWDEMPNDKSLPAHAL